ncbi:MAG: DUF1573 domain-containing protein [Deltaproteobacteria bacterium]|nr:DUF1573 domain-containing protein [Deltaproteobacteria bacterium]MBI3390737.1 DUF1573 domain-containing protein [Deltaproteobacteria bacterium]
MPLLIGLALLSLQCEPEATPRAPHLSFDATVHDFATVEQGTPATHAFSFHNSGGADLIINNLMTASDCTAEAVPRVVPAGGSGAIQARCDTARLFGTTSRTITVYSNDPAQPVTTLALRGDIAVDVAADPPALYLGHVRRGARAENEARIITGRPLILRLQADQGRTLRASLLDTPTGKILAVTIAPDAPIGRFNESVTLITSSSRHATLTVPVVGIVDEEKD